MIRPARRATFLRLDKFNETAFRTLDEVLAAANRNGIRLIIPLVNNWPWMGGRAEYAGFRGKDQGRFLDGPATHRRFRADHPFHSDAHQHNYRRSLCRR